MESEFVKAIIGLLSAGGAIALFKLNLVQSEQARAEILEKFEKALAEGQKNATTELFRMLYGLRMSFPDIKAIVTDDNAGKIIYALRKTPGMVQFVNGRFEYSSIYKRSWVRTFDSAVSKALAYVVGTLTVGTICGAVVMPGLVSLVLLVGAIPLMAFLAMQLYSIRYDTMVRSLVGSGEA